MTSKLKNRADRMVQNGTSQRGYSPSRDECEINMADIIQCIIIISCGLSVTSQHNNTTERRSYTCMASDKH